MQEIVLVEIVEGIALLTLNRPAKLNALSYAMIDRLMQLLDTFETATEVRAIILTGAGERAFSAGADIFEFSESVRAGANVAVRDFVRRGQALTARLEAYGKPVIAAVNGLAFGGTQRLPRLVGRKRALELLLTGESFSPARALAMGLVNAVVPAENLLAAARDLAGQVARHPPGAVQAILTAVARGSNMSIGEGLQVESEQFARLAAMPEISNSLASWAARRDF